MQISHRHQFLFVHVPKTAGASVAAALNRYVDDPKQYLANRLLESIGIRVNHLIGPAHWRRFRGHSGLRTAKRVLPSAVYERMFKFAFVRNPWDLLVSRYHFLLRTRKHRQHKRVVRLGNFSNYVRWHAARRGGTQWEMLADTSGQLLANDLGRFENLNEDFLRIQLQIGIPPVPLQHRNATERKDYRCYYDDATAELVATRWRQDVEGFGYTFDGAIGTMNSPPKRMAA